MDLNLLAVLGTLGGVVLGFFLNLVTTYFQQRKEDKRLLRRALFNLLNLYNIIIPPEFGEASSLMQEWIRSHDPNVANIYDSERLQEELRKLLEPMIVPFKEDALRRMSVTYESAILDISQIDPLLAYTLSGRSRVQTDLRHFLESLQKINQPSPNGDDTKQISAIIGEMKKFYDTQLSKRIEFDIISVAKRIGFLARIRTSRLLNNVKGQTDPELISKYFEHIDEAIKRSQQMK